MSPRIAKLTSLLAPLLIAHCALFSPRRDEAVVYPLAQTSPRPAQGVARPPPSTAPAPPNAPVGQSEVVAAQGFRVRRGMLIGLAPPDAPDPATSFALLRGLIERRRVRVLDLTQSTGLRARVEHPSREGTVLEGPWESAQWAARWGGASHLLVSDASQSRLKTDGTGWVASCALRLLNLPGAEAVWVARVERHGATDAEARGRVIDALLDALHGTLRDEPEPDDPAAIEPRPTAPRQRRHRSRRHTR